MSFSRFTTRHIHYFSKQYRRTFHTNKKLFQQSTKPNPHAPLKPTKLIFRLLLIGIAIPYVLAQLVGDKLYLLSERVSNADERRKQIHQDRDAEKAEQKKKNK